PADVGPVVVAAAVLPDAVAAIDRSVELGPGVAVPEIDVETGRVDEVHLVRDRGLDDNRAARRHPSGIERVVRERAGIVDDAIKTGVETAAWRNRDIDDAVEREITADLDEIVERAANDVCLAELEIEDRTAVENQVTVDRQDTGAVSGREDATGCDGHVATDHAGPAKPRARGNAGRPRRRRLIAIDPERTGADRRRTRVAVVAGQDRRARADLIHGAGADDRSAVGQGVGAIEA